jgi:phospholipid/cholesterol/gamma-HCH transport system substrate-binding protein
VATPSNHWKLGLFVVCGIALGLAGVVVLGARGLHENTVSYQSYFDESVQGLEVGSPVKFRGVTIGTVSRIAIAPDRRHVGVTSDLGVDQINLMGLGHDTGRKFQIHVPADLRMQLASAGITGVKFLQLDFFSVAGNPAPKLPFPVPENHIPAAVSTMKNIEDAVVHAVAGMPTMIEASLKLIAKVDSLVNDVGEARLADRALITLTTAERVLADIRTTVNALEAGKVSTQAQVTLAHLDGAIARLDAMLVRIDGEEGVIVSAGRASDAVGDVAVNARGLTDDLGATMRDVQQAAQSIQKLADTLERDPDMLLKGRASSTP